MRNGQILIEKLVANWKITLAKPDGLALHFICALWHHMPIVMFCQSQYILPRPNTGES